MIRKWQFLESKHRVFCNGRCITGRNLGVFIFALVLICITSGLFFAFDCPYLIDNISPIVPICAAILFLNVICCILRTACSDPGILPRATSDEILYFEKSENKPLSGRIMELQMRSGLIIQLKYCQTCKIFRPPRVSHCSLCNACIANFDHHCPWVGNCVGLRNYRYFYLFLLSLSLLCIYIFVFNIIHIVLLAQIKPTVADAIRETPATIVEALICFLSIWSILGLWGYHTYLICRSVTTNEDIKETWNSSVINPFSRGNCWLDCFSTLCGPLPPSFLNLRALVKQENNISMNTQNGRVWDSSIEYPPQQNRFIPRDYV
jgi:palmitoyltransferase ZDHHC9/14/18